MKVCEKFLTFRYLCVSEILTKSSPVIVARGSNKGPIFAITVAIHGNEINGIVVVQRLMANLDLKSLSGTVVAM